MNKKGQMNILNAIPIILLIIIWILLSPFFSELINDILGSNDFGGFTNFLIKIIHWVGLIFLVILLIRTLQGYSSEAQR